MCNDTAASTEALMQQTEASHGKSSLGALSLAALGVVFGDIGTSPLYTMKEVFAGNHPIPLTADNVLGILSLILWSLIIIVSIKYVVFVMRADNRGEGGIMALIALALRYVQGSRHKEKLVMMIGIAGAAMFYGDGMVTPAISVLSAVEGLEVAAPVLKPFVIPLTLLVLFILFFFQRKGTASVGALFGPVMVIWFAILALIGLSEIVSNPSVLRAANPWYGLEFLFNNRSLALVAMGAVVLSITGAEALYADMGHFGRKPVEYAWFGFVLPSLMLNYFGQGALILREPEAIQNPFYLSAPDWALYPLIALATVATVIASQAVISGAFSITREAMQLGFVPRLAVLHTSDQQQGQIYLPAVNWGLMTAVFILVLGFKSSNDLAAAYGIAVTGNMVMTSVLATVVVAKIWGWGWWRAAPVFAFFMLLELSFLGANLLKIPDGGWFPLVVGVLMMMLMTTWKRGRQLLSDRLRGESFKLEPFIDSIAIAPPARVPGTAIFMNADPHGVPHAMLHNLMHNKVLHERVVILTIRFEDRPYVPESERVEVLPLKEEFFRVIVRYGFKDEPDIPQALQLCTAQGLELQMMETSFFLGRETLIPKLGSEMALWREKLFVAMFRNAGSATTFFNIPSNRVVELGTQVVL
jgi:KUP system potassium uptake protein